MKKRKGKNKRKDWIFVAVLLIVVAIVGIGARNVVKGQGVLGKTIRITIGDNEIVIGDDDVLIDVEEGDDIFGGLIHNVQEDFSEGISVDGTEVIDGSGNWVGDILAVTTAGARPTWGSSEVCSCLIMGDENRSRLSYATVSGSIWTVTGGTAGTFSIPVCCE